MILPAFGSNARPGSASLVGPLTSAGVGIILGSWTADLALRQKLSRTSSRFDSFNA